MRVRLRLCTLILCAITAWAAPAQHVSAPEPQPLSAPEPQTGAIVGTVTDVQGDIVPDATVVLEGPTPGDQRTVAANDNGFFALNDIKPGITYHIAVSAKGFANWTSPALTITPGQYMNLPNVVLQIAVAVTTVTAVLSQEQLATQQIEIEEKQRVLGFIPNFYVTYEHDPAPLPTKLKFKLALHTSLDPVTFLGSAFIAATDQAGDTPDYQQGLKGYGQRFGANYANGLTDIMIGGAVLPSLLHQDPRYFYRGTGTTKSRVIHALSSPFWCRGDNGRWQPNYSSLGGYLASGAIAETYYPESNRGPGLVFGTFGIDVAANMANSIIQEFVLRKLTPSAKNQN
jgi:Carboxypeptidase regulatory-like domain